MQIGMDAIGDGAAIGGEADEAKKSPYDSMNLTPDQRAELEALDADAEHSKADQFAGETARAEASADLKKYFGVKQTSAERSSGVTALLSESKPKEIIAPQAEAGGETKPRTESPRAEAPKRDLQAELAALNAEIATSNAARAEQGKAMAEIAADTQAKIAFRKTTGQSGTSQG